MKSGSTGWVCGLALALTIMLGGCNGDGADSAAQTSPSTSSVETATLAQGSDPSSAATLPDASDTTATLTWEPPTVNTDGSTITDLAGYRIYYGTSASALDQVIDISNIGITTYVVESLTPGTWYFAIKAYTTDGSESALSNVAMKTIT